MKKMMVMMAIMLVAGLSQAATVSWSTGTIKVPTLGTGAFGANTGTTTALYLANITFYADNGGVAGAAISGITGSTLTDNSTSVASVLNGTTAGTSFSASTKYWAQVVVTTAVNGGAGSWIMTSDRASFTVPGTGNANLTFLTGGGFDVASNHMPAVWTAVPEPTSLALLALGAAAMGLRRKFRK